MQFHWPKFGQWIAFLAAVVALNGLASGAEDRPNVVLILSDDQAYTDYSFMGHAQIKTPNLDRLASESLAFTRGYVPTSLCRPSLMSIITGRYAHEHGVTGNDPPSGVNRALMLEHVRRAATLPKILGERGYVSFQSGKWWEGGFQEGGFAEGMTHGDPARGGRHGDLGLKIGREGLAPVFQFIEKHPQKPFFVWYAPMLPHQPHNPPPRLLEKYAKLPGISPHVAKYYAMCEWWDETCGTLLDYLRDQKLSQNTLVIYVTDNGWIQDPAKPVFAPRSKRSPYEGGVRTPILVRWPARLKPRRDNATLVTSLDIFPTVLAACGVTAPSNLPGMNLLELKADAAPARQELFGEIFAHDVADITNPRASLLSRWCISGQFKLIIPVPGGPAELYNLQADPQELKNLTAAQPDLVRDLTSQMNAWWPEQR